MKARALKKILNNTNYIVHETSEHICVGSPLCHDLISIRKDNMHMRYALDTFHKGKSSIGHGELLMIWEMLEGLIISGRIKDFIHGEDIIENPLPVFSHNNDWQIIESFTDEYGWPNTDITGRLMYDNTWFKTKEEAIARAIAECTAGIQWREEVILEKLQDITKFQHHIKLAQAAKKRLTDMA